MPTVYVPPPMRDLTNGQETVDVVGTTVAQIIAELDARFAGLRVRLCAGDALKPGWAVVVDGQVARQGLRAKVMERSEVHFLPAIGGGGGVGSFAKQ